MNLDRKIAAKAKDLVKEVFAKDFTERESEYRALCESFPILLRTAGLAQSITFLKAKREHPHGTLAGHVEAQLRNIEMLSEAEDLVAVSTRLPMSDYRLYSQMAGRVAYWQKRMAQAYLRTKKEGGQK